MKVFKLRDSRVIFDGQNLIHVLYNKICSTFGGEYEEYADTVRNYFTAFLDCNITPIIIFDGGIDKSGRKLNTKLKRAEAALAQVERITKGSYKENFLPALGREVFLSVLMELDIDFAVCDYEADDQICALANHYECPVISTDSDFYIYDVRGGFIRVDSIDTKINKFTDSEGKRHNYLKCKIYHINKFVSYFPGICKDVLPLFGTLIGNDYVDGKEVNDFFSNVQLPKYDNKKFKNLFFKPKDRKMIDLLGWLKNFKTLDEAVCCIIQHFKESRRDNIRTLIKRSIDAYKLPTECDLTLIIEKKINNLNHDLRSTSRLTTPCGNFFPLEFLVKFHSGQYSSVFINVIVLHKVVFYPQIEDISLPDTEICSGFIRRVIYGILVRHDVDGNTCQNEKCLSSIEENGRQGNIFQKQLVEPIFSLEGVGMLPKINELHKLKKRRSISILKKVLGINPDYFSKFPDEWQLLFGCFKYWLCNCEPRCRKSFLYGLIINLIHFSIIKYKCFSKEEFKCINKKSAEVDCSCSSVRCIISKITESELQSIAKNFEKYYKPSVDSSNPLLLHIVHSYSQLQSCFVDIVNLNKLLGEHMLDPAPHKCFSGTLLYNLTKDISSRSDAELFVEELLGRETTLHVLFKALISEIYQNVPSDCILKEELPRKKNKKKQAKILDSPSKNVKSLNATKSFGSSSKNIQSFGALNSEEML